MECYPSVEIISQHIRASNHRVVHLKLIQCYMSIMSIKMEGKKELCNVLFYFQTLKKKAIMLKVIMCLSWSEHGLEKSFQTRGRMKEE